MAYTHTVFFGVSFAHWVCLASRRLFTHGGSAHIVSIPNGFAQQLLSTIASAYMVAIPDGSTHWLLSATAWPIWFLSPMASLNGCYPQWLLLMRLLSLIAPLTGCYPRWLLLPIWFFMDLPLDLSAMAYEPIRCLGIPFHFDRDGIYCPYDSCSCWMSTLWPFSPAIAFALWRVMWVLRFAYSWSWEFLLRLGTDGS